MVRHFHHRVVGAHVVDVGDFGMVASRPMPLNCMVKVPRLGLLLAPGGSNVTMAPSGVRTNP